MNDFQKWRADTEQQIGDWTNWLFCEALKKGTYNAGIHWLQKNKPDAPTSYNATPVETFVNGVVTGMFQTAKIEIRHEAFKQSIERKDK